MPVYDYFCPDCDLVHEISRKMDDEVKECPACKSKKIAQVFTGFKSIRFKGQGFHKNDYHEWGPYEY